MKLPGNINAHSLSIILKELVRRAINEVSVIMQQADLGVTFKKVAEGSTAEDDFFTVADTNAQIIIAKSLRECFPGYGIIGEEKLFVPCTLPSGIILYFTIDPLDGTRAFRRRQSHGIGTMISLINGDGNVLCAWIGDVMTKEMYGYRPGSSKVWRAINYERFTQLNPDPLTPLKDQYLLSRDNPSEFPTLPRSFFIKGKHGGVFRDFEITGGSIGISTARLWKQEVGAQLLKPGPEHPWDICPILGINQKLGFVTLDILDGNKAVLSTIRAGTKTIQRTTPSIMLHENRVNEFIQSSGMTLF
ncbi:MAG: hypothetical protein EXS59_02495 [Candidatus Taylorbacteria bacterium]|nr:hypothetical protein [Candidatus Taylorbacteria bacterium]